jgi:hypothetical protein
VSTQSSSSPRPSAAPEVVTCRELQPEQVCFCVRRYQEGHIDVLVHYHVPLRRTSEERRCETLQTLVATSSHWPAEWVINSLLNSRRGEPERYPGFVHDVSYPEPGVLRHTVSSGNVWAWCDTVVVADAFRS